MSSIPPRMQVDRSIIDFGKKIPGAKLVARFRLRNGGGRELVISNIRSSCGCAPAMLLQPNLGPQEETYLSLEFALPISQGQIGHAVAFDTNDPHRPTVSLRVFASGRWPVTVEPERVVLSSVLLEETRRFAVEITSDRAETFIVEQCDLSSECVKVCEHSKNGNRHRYVMEFNTKRPGYFTEQIVFKTNSQERPTIIIPVEGKAEGRLVAKPRQVVLGQVKPSTVVNCSFAIHSRLHESISVDSVSIADATWRIETWRFDPSADEPTLNLSLCVPEGAGYAKTVLTIRFRNAVDSLVVPVSGLLSFRSTAGQDQQ